MHFGGLSHLPLLLAYHLPSTSFVRDGFNPKEMNMSFTEINGLTKKNQEFIHIATNQLIKDGKSDSEIKELLEEILPTIIENQKMVLLHVTCMGHLVNGAASKSTSAKEKNDQVEYNENPWLMWVDSSLLMLAIIAGVNGLMNLFGQGAQYGLVTLLVIGFGVGAGMYFYVPLRL